MRGTSHVLSRLKLPRKYEQLENAVGAEVTRLLAEPEESIEKLRRAAETARVTGEGLLIPVHGTQGQGRRR